jgi:hypothetical protein
MKDGLQTRVDSVIDEAISKKRIVGTVILISLDGAIVYQRPAGFADREVFSVRGGSDCCVPEAVLIWLASILYERASHLSLRHSTSVRPLRA